MSRGKTRVINMGHKSQRELEKLREMNFASYGDRCLVDLQL